MIGMRHLQLVLVTLDLAADDACRTDRKRAVQVIRMRMEIDELHPGRVIGTANAIGPAPVARCDVIEHSHSHSRDASFFRVDQPWTIRAVDQSDRQIEDQIDDPGPGDPRDQLLELGADAAKRARFGEQREENRRAHCDERIWTGEVVLNGAKALYPAHGKQGKRWLFGGPPQTRSEEHTSELQ